MSGFNYLPKCFCSQRMMQLLGSENLKKLAEILSCDTSRKAYDVSAKFRVQVGTESYLLCSVRFGANRKKSRVIFFIAKNPHTKIPEIVLLDYLENHKYDTCPFMDRSYLNAYIKNVFKTSIISEVESESLNEFEQISLNPSEEKYYAQPVFLQKNDSFLHADSYQKNLLDLYQEKYSHLFVIAGLPGTGKTSVIQFLIENAKKDSYKSIHYVVPAQSSMLRTQISEHFERNSTGMYSAESGQNILILSIDEKVPEEYASVSIEKSLQECEAFFKTQNKYHPKKYIALRTYYDENGFSEIGRLLTELRLFGNDIEQYHSHIGKRDFSDQFWNEFHAFYMQVQEKLPALEIKSFEQTDSNLFCIDEAHHISLFSIAYLILQMNDFDKMVLIYDKKQDLIWKKSSSLEFLKKWYLYIRPHLILSMHTLQKHYRCPLNVRKYAADVTALIDQFFQSRTQKTADLSMMANLSEETFSSHSRSILYTDSINHPDFDQFCQQIPENSPDFIIIAQDPEQVRSIFLQKFDKSFIVLSPSEVCGIETKVICTFDMIPWKELINNRALFEASPSKRERDLSREQQFLHNRMTAFYLAITRPTEKLLIVDQCQSKKHHSSQEFVKNYMDILIPKVTVDAKKESPLNLIDGSADNLKIIQQSLPTAEARDRFEKIYLNHLTPFQDHGSEQQSMQAEQEISESEKIENVIACMIEKKDFSQVESLRPLKNIVKKILCLHSSLQKEILKLLASQEQQAVIFSQNKRDNKKQRVISKDFLDLLLEQPLFKDALKIDFLSSDNNLIKKNGIVIQAPFFIAMLYMAMDCKYYAFLLQKILVCIYQPENGSLQKSNKRKNWYKLQTQHGETLQNMLGLCSEQCSKDFAETFLLEPKFIKLISDNKKGLQDHASIIIDTMLKGFMNPESQDSRQCIAKLFEILQYVPLHSDILYSILTSQYFWSAVKQDELDIIYMMHQSLLTEELRFNDEKIVILALGLAPSLIHSKFFSRYLQDSKEIPVLSTEEYKTLIANLHMYKVDMNILHMLCAIYIRDRDLDYRMSFSDIEKSLQPIFDQNSLDMRALAYIRVFTTRKLGSVCKEILSILVKNQKFELISPFLLEMMQTNTYPTDGLYEFCPYLSPINAEMMQGNRFDYVAVCQGVIHLVCNDIANITNYEKFFFWFQYLSEEELKIVLVEQNGFQAIVDCLEKVSQSEYKKNSLRMLIRLLIPLMNNPLIEHIECDEQRYKDSFEYTKHEWISDLILADRGAIAEQSEQKIIDTLNAPRTENFDIDAFFRDIRTQNKEENYMKMIRICYQTANALPQQKTFLHDLAHQITLRINREKWIPEKTSDFLEVINRLVLLNLVDDNAYEYHQYIMSHVLEEYQEDQKKEFYKQSYMYSHKRDHCARGDVQFKKETFIQWYIGLLKKMSQEKYQHHLSVFIETMKQVMEDSDRILLYMRYFAEQSALYNQFGYDDGCERVFKHICAEPVEKHMLFVNKNDITLSSTVFDSLGLIFFLESLKLIDAVQDISFWNHFWQRVFADREMSAQLQGLHQQRSIYVLFYQMQHIRTPSLFWWTWAQTGTKVREEIFDVFYHIESLPDKVITPFTCAILMGENANLPVDPIQQGYVKMLHDWKVLNETKDNQRVYRYFLNLWVQFELRTKATNNSRVRKNILNYVKRFQGTFSFSETENKLLQSLILNSCKMLFNNEKPCDSVFESFRHMLDVFKQNITPIVLDEPGLREAVYTCVKDRGNQKKFLDIIRRFCRDQHIFEKYPGTWERYFLYAFDCLDKEGCDKEWFDQNALQIPEQTLITPGLLELEDLLKDVEVKNTETHLLSKQKRFDLWIKDQAIFFVFQYYIHRHTTDSLEHLQNAWIKLKTNFEQIGAAGYPLELMVAHYVSLLATEKPKNPMQKALQGCILTVFKFSMSKGLLRTNLSIAFEEKHSLTNVFMLMMQFNASKHDPYNKLLKDAVNILSSMNIQYFREPRSQFENRNLLVFMENWIMGQEKNDVHGKLMGSLLEEVQRCQTRSLDKIFNNVPKVGDTDYMSEIINYFYGTETNGFSEDIKKAKMLFNPLGNVQKKSSQPVIDQNNNVETNEFCEDMQRTQMIFNQLGNVQKKPSQPVMDQNNNVETNEFCEDMQRTQMLFNPLGNVQKKSSQPVIDQNNNAANTCSIC